MGDVAIHVEGLGKRFNMRRASGVRSGTTLREDLLSIPREILSALSSTRGANAFWALRDASFEVACGEVLGIVGRNGAGKSTLLKLLGRIMDPTCGHAVVRGRIGSLLEVGTGFHPELTGRENIFLSGALLGMRRCEVRTRFDEIVDFAGIEAFLDTPCKHYSSGMYTRLGFAVAAHLDAEILLIDEVLAVGDAGFQRKCLGKMGSIARDGRTVLFVSHNMAAMEAMCGRGLLLSDGVIAGTGRIRDIVASYLSQTRVASDLPISLRTERGGDGTNRLTRVRVFGDSSHPGAPIQVGGPATFLFSAQGSMDRLVFAIYGKSGELIADFDSAQMVQRDGVFPCHSVDCKVRGVFLVPGRYFVNVAIFNQGRMTDHVEAALSLEIREGEVDGMIVGASARGQAVFPHAWSRKTYDETEV